MPERWRVFFALWPEAPLANALHALGAGREGRAHCAADLHLTLAFLGEVEAPALARLQEIAAALPLPACTIEIDRLGYWAHNRILWAGPSHWPAPLQQFVATLHQRLREAGFRLEERPFAPHVSLLRKAPAVPEAALPALSWSLAAWHLAASSPAQGEGLPRYQLLASWPVH